MRKYYKGKWLLGKSFLQIPFFDYVQVLFDNMQLFVLWFNSWGQVNPKIFRRAK